ncbi:MAG: SEC-C metal-binding domain-containing protein [Bryobacteraceae bacterium]|jgi:uncharacterized protein YecA (UPF0149 family)
MADLFAAMAEADRMHFSQQPADAQNCTTMHNNAQPEPKTGRSNMCPCGSGRKYKHCCLNKSSAAPPDA